MALFQVQLPLMLPQKAVARRLDSMGLFHFFETLLCSYTATNELVSFPTYSLQVTAQRTYKNWKASMFNVEETVNRSRMFISRSRMHLHNLATKVWSSNRYKSNSIFQNVLSSLLHEIKNVLSVFVFDVLLGRWSTIKRRFCH
jgi:hypothetical protein